MRPGMTGKAAIAMRPRLLATIRGGQGSINVNSWSPDSRRFAYVSYGAAKPE